MRTCSPGCWRSTSPPPWHGKYAVNNNKCWLLVDKYWLHRSYSILRLLILKLVVFLLCHNFCSDAPLDFRLKSNLVADLLSLVGK